MMLNFIIIFFIFFSTCSIASSLEDKYIREFGKLDKEQLAIAKEIFYRAKPYNLEYIAVAIAWQESNLGMFPINLQDPSCGPFHINIKTYTSRYKIPKSSFNFNKSCSSLINDIDVSVTAFLAEIEAWKVVHKRKKDVWEYVFRSYNAGYNVNSQRAISYSNSIKNRINVLKKFLKI